MCQPSLSLTLVRCFLSPCVPWYITKDKMWIKNHETCSSITQAVTLFWKRVLLSRSQFYNFRVCEVVHLNGNIYYYGGVERNLLPLQHTYMWVREKIYINYFRMLSPWLCVFIAHERKQSCMRTCKIKQTMDIKLAHEWMNESEYEYMFWIDE